MGTTESPAAAPVKVVVAPDRLKAWIEYAPGARVSRTEVGRQLQEAGLSVGESRLEELVAALQALKEAGSVLVAEGRAAVDDVPAGVELLIKQEAAPAEQSGSHYDRAHMLMVQADQPIARVIEPSEGVDGIDVCGRAIPHKRYRAERVKLGQNVKLAGDGKTIIAEVPGVLKQNGATLGVEKVLYVKGNVDFSVGNIEFAGDVNITGNVIDLFKVHSSGGSVSVQGTVEAADVYAKVDVTVHGGVAAREKGRCMAGHDLSARYLRDVSAEAGNDMHVHSEIANSRVVCGGKLVLDRGSLLSGHVTANGGVHCHTLGSSANVAVLVEAGVDEKLRHDAAAAMAQIEAQRRQAKKVKDTVEPLLANPKTLTAQQKEKATELLYHAAEADSRIKEQLKQLKAQYDAAQARSAAEVKIDAMLYAGVTIRFEDVETTIQSPMRGPLRVLRKHEQGQTHIVAVDDRGGSLMLEAHAVADTTMAKVSRLLQEI